MFRVAIVVLLLFISFTFSADAVILKPTDRQREVFVDIIKPEVFKIWKNKKQVECDFYILQNIGGVSLVRVDISGDYEIYIISVLFYAEYFLNNKKVDETQMS